MHSISERPAWGLAEAFDFSSVDRLLDVGGGSGVLSIAIAKKWTNVSATIFDLSVVCDIARAYVSGAGLTDRIKAQPGDMFQDEWPVGYDAILLSQILHDWSETTGKALLGKAYKALPAGGRILVHEKLVHSDQPGPLANALVNLDMMVWTEGQQYTETQLVRALDEVGFTDIDCRPTTGYWSAVIGKK
jgi:cyclopropane fatty-acyl-phospholipid synthase-like methyltransferase